MKQKAPTGTLFAKSPAWLCLVVLSLALSLSACEKDAGPLPANMAPTTYLQIQGSEVDTLNYRQILNWWGSDPDGSVIGYCISWDGAWTPPEDALACGFDSSFVFTTTTTDTFIVETEGTYAERRFRVHAVDNDGIIDPEGKEQLFRLENFVPEVFWSNTFDRPSQSLPVVSFAFTYRDEDGRETVPKFRVWLDPEPGQEPVVQTVSDTLIALEADQFGGRFDERTLFVQAVDEANTPSNVIEHTWMVEPVPEQSFLLIDNAGSSTPGEAIEDEYYRAILDSVAAGDYFVYDIDERGNFRSMEEILPLFRLFDGVVWYGGTRNTTNDAIIRTNLDLAEDGMRAYLKKGGRVVLAHPGAVGDDSGLTTDFAEDVLGVQGLYRESFIPEMMEFGEHNIRIRSRSKLGTIFLAPGDSLELSSSTPDADVLLLDSDVTATFEIPAGFLDAEEYVPEQTTPAAVGVQSSRVGGKIGLVTFLLSRANRSENGHEAGANFLREILLR